MNIQKWMYNETTNKAVVIQSNGAHRIYSNNKAKNTQLYLNRKGQSKIMELLSSFGYTEITSKQFSEYFKTGLNN